MSSGQRDAPFSSPCVRLASQKPPFRPDAAQPTVWDAQPGLPLDGAQRGPEPGVPAADDHEIGVRVSPKRRVCGPTPPDVVGPERRGHGASKRVLDRGG